jgi:hypothetical protein
MSGYGKLWALIAAAVLLCLAAPAQSGAARKGSHGASLNVRIPAPGHVAVETLKVTVKGKGRRLSARLRLRPKKLSSLPPSVRVLYARRKIRRKHSTTYALALLSVNVAGAQAKTSALAQAGGEQHEGQLLNGSKGAFHGFGPDATMALFFGSPLAAEFLQQEEDDSYDAEQLRLRTLLRTTSAANADLASPAQAQKIGQTLNELFSGAKGDLVFGDNQQDPTLDTGHYDDGHAFGWNVKTSEDEKKVFSDLGAFTNNQLSALIANIERDMGADVNGDGAIAAPGQTIDTTIGPPTIH